VFIKARIRNLEHAKNVLEEEVKKRTAEIRQQKDEIEAQRDEIEAQRNYVTKQKDKIELQNKISHPALSMQVEFRKQCCHQKRTSNNIWASILSFLNHAILLAETFTT
jgi:chromosome segregation ATPase